MKLKNYYIYYYTYYLILGFTFSPVTLKSDSLIIDYIATNYPNALLIAGGLNIARLPFKDIFGIIPFDIFIAGPGETILPKLISKLP